MYICWFINIVIANVVLAGQEYVFIAVLLCWCMMRRIVVVSLVLEVVEVVRGSPVEDVDSVAGGLDVIDPVVGPTRPIDAHSTTR